MRVAIPHPEASISAPAVASVASRIGLQAEGLAFGRDDDLQARVAADIAAHGPCTAYWSTRRSS